MLAAMVLGADAVQIGSRYICTPEASSHLAFKEAIIHTQEGDTELSLKQLTPVRLIKNEFYQQVKQAEEACADKESLKNILGKGRAKLGMFEGNLVDGELEVGQVGAMIKDIIPAGELTQQIWQEFVNLGYKLFP
jgi:enoyl-[acyl-carrier protein] reductase II